MTQSIDLTAAVRAEEDRLIDIRRHLHANPELSNEEHETTKLVVAEMEAIGATRIPLDIATGAAFLLEGGRPGRTVLLRADLDGLPITEERDDLTFASKRAGAMHACGHDAHTAGLVGTARALAAHVEDLPGRYVITFQPAEEGQGGAKEMVAAGLLEATRPDVALGWHCASIFPTGYVGTRNDVLMAGFDAFSFELHGTGGHGALAASLGGNVLLSAAGIAGRLDAAVAEQVYEGTPCSCSAGILESGTAPNVIPAHARVGGTLRTFTPAQRSEAMARLADLAAEVSASEGVHVELQWTNSSDPVVNDPAVSDQLREAARGVLGADGVIELPPVTPSEDMSEFLNRVPGCFFFVGAGLPDGSSGGHHMATFAIDDACVGTGAAVLAEAAQVAARS